MITIKLQILLLQLLLMQLVYYSYSLHFCWISPLHYTWLQQVR